MSSNAVSDAISQQQRATRRPSLTSAAVVASGKAKVWKVVHGITAANALSQGTQRRHDVHVKAEKRAQILIKQLDRRDNLAKNRRRNTISGAKLQPISKSELALQEKRKLLWEYNQSPIEKLSQAKAKLEAVRKAQLKQAEDGEKQARADALQLQQADLKRRSIIFSDSISNHLYHKQKEVTHGIVEESRQCRFKEAAEEAAGKVPRRRNTMMLLPTLELTTASGRRKSFTELFSDGPGALAQAARLAAKTVAKGVESTVMGIPNTVDSANRMHQRRHSFAAAARAVTAANKMQKTLGASSGLNRESAGRNQQKPNMAAALKMAQIMGQAHEGKGAASRRITLGPLEAGFANSQMGPAPRKSFSAMLRDRVRSASYRIQGKAVHGKEDMFNIGVENCDLGEIMACLGLDAGLRDAVDDRGRTPLHLLVHRAGNGDGTGADEDDAMRCIRYLLSPQVRASPVIAAMDGSTPLHHASQNGNALLVAELCRAGAIIDGITIPKGFTPLMLAVHRRHLQVLKIGLG